MAAAHDPELDYLLPDFDPSTLTVARLRLILVSHDINYPSSAKKPQLIEIFNHDVVPQARKILGARSRTKRTSKGITDADPGPDEAANGTPDPHLMPPPARPRSPRKKTPRESSRPTTETPESDDLPQTTPKKTPGRRSSVKPSRVSDTESPSDATPVRPAAKKVRRSEVTPAVKVEEPEPEDATPAGDESVFSDDNPFQSGSSPISGDGDERRRKSAGPLGQSEGRRKSGGTRRKTDQAVGKVIKAEAEASARPYVIKAEYDDGVPAGEEFTPEEQIELSREQLKRGARDVTARELMRSRPRSTGLSRSAPWVVLLTLLGGYGVWWRQEKLAVGYCGVGRAPMTIPNVDVPDWATVLRPQCQPCPAHAYCYPDLYTTCESDFVLQSHPLALGGLVPLAPTCEPDGEKVGKVKAVADRAVEELRERRAQYECGGVEPGSEEVVATAEIDEEVLKKEVGKKRRKGMTEAEFEELWKGAADEILERDEVVVEQVDESTGRRSLSSTSLARVPLRCAIQRSARLALARYRVELGGIMTALVGLLLLRSYLRSLNDAKARVPDLVKLTLDRLATQAAIHAQDPRAVPEPWVLVGQLRDDVLRDEFSPGRREALWTRVRAVVEVNANVRASVKETRGGEIGRVWEWIGSVGAVEDALSAGRRASGAGRLSWGGGGESGDFGSSPGSSRSLATPTPAHTAAGHNDGKRNGREEMTQRAWTEGRPIY